MNIFIKVVQLNSAYLMASVKAVCFTHSRLKQEMKDFANMYDGCAFE